MDFIYVALGAVFWASIALMARGCDVLQGRKPSAALPTEGASSEAAMRRVAP